MENNESLQHNPIYHPQKITVHPSLSNVNTNKVEQYVGNVKEKWLNEIPTLWHEMFPNGIQRLIRQREKEIINEELKHQRDLIKILKNAELEAVKESVKNHLIDFVSQQQAQFSQKMAERSLEFELTYSDLLNDLLTVYEQRLEEISKCQNNFSRQRRERDLEQLIERFIQKKELIITNYYAGFEEIKNKFSS